MTTTQHFDLLVLGFGKAGKTIAMKRAKAGDRVALIETDPAMFGGTCINIGCVPTKKLLTEMAAHELLAAAAADSSDATTGEAAREDAAWEKAVTARDGLIAKMNAANKGMADKAGVTVIVGTARMVGERTVEVAGGDEELQLTADTIIINTGAVPVWPGIPGIDGDNIVDSTGVQHIDRPQRLAIVGGGPIGMEFASLFAGFGTKVTVLDAAARPFARFDEDVAEMAADVLRTKGVTFVTGAKVTGFQHAADDTQDPVTVTFETDGEEHSLPADKVLVAIGRRPATDGLNLEAADIDTDDRGAIIVDERLRTTADGVYAAGDVNGGPQFTYISFDDHRVILHDRWGVGQPRTTAGRIIPTTTFLEPPLATVGASRADVADRIASGEVSERVVKIADVPILPRPKIVGRPEGMARLLVDTKTDKILGATLMCIDAQELINTVAVAMRAGMSATDFVEGIYTHPATSEVFNALG